MDRAGGKAARGGGGKNRVCGRGAGLAILCVVLGTCIRGRHRAIHLIVSRAGLFHPLRPADGQHGTDGSPAPDGIRRQEGQATAVPVCDVQRAESGADFRAQGAEGDAAPARRDAPRRGIDALWFLSALFLAEIAFKTRDELQAGGENRRVSAWRSGRRVQPFGAAAQRAGGRTLVWPNVVSRAMVGCILIGMGYGSAASGRAFGSRGRRSMG